MWSAPLHIPSYETGSGSSTMRFPNFRPYLDPSGMPVTQHQGLYRGSYPHHAYPHPSHAFESRNLNRSSDLRKVVDCQNHFPWGSAGVHRKMRNAQRKNAIGREPKLPKLIPCPGPQYALSSLKLHYANEKGRSEDEIGLYCLSDAGLTALGEGFTKLDKLSLLWCSNVTSAGLKSIAEKCCSLRSLDLQDCCVGDQGAAGVGKCCRQLEDLNLQFCKGLTDTALIVLAIGCGKTLKYVGVTTCVELTYISLEAIGSHCRSLEKLSLDSEFINNKGILVVAKGCHLLKVLKLQCINVTDETLQAVGIFCLSLELLALYSFQRFTGKSLCAIGEGFLDTAAGVWCDTKFVVTTPRTGRYSVDAAGGDAAGELMRRYRHASAAIGDLIFIYGGLRGGKTSQQNTQFFSLCI
ncbi:F-box/LRR-repeat protein 4 [Camellia lanceoleosa]|uniref:F-box/LRR-repeat protein 4 n=1 Tax=Camellia lanceoleosa TaxID=1840588 RepID=A0ACC0GZJ8_9ERIC|nr:F-box/LRR-repeat protein 4 [Camellia lanceoleosa]